MPVPISGTGKLCSFLYACLLAPAILSFTPTGFPGHFSAAPATAAPATIVGDTAKWANYTSEIARMRQKLKKRADAIKRKNGSWQNHPHVFAKVYELDSRVDRLTSTLAMIHTLDTSSQRYTVVDTSCNTSVGQGGTFLRATDTVIEFAVGGVDNFVHEITHGSQYEMHSLLFIIHPGAKHIVPFGDDVFDEISAYKAEYALHPNAVRALGRGIPLPCMDSINVRWLLNLKNEKGETIYKPGDSAHVVSENIDINSTNEDVKTAYYFLPHIADWVYKTVKDDPQMIFKH